MKSYTLAIESSTQQSPQLRWIDQIAKRIFMHKFNQINDGQIIVREGKSEYIFGETTEDYTRPVFIVMSFLAAPSAPVKLIWLAAGIVTSLALWYASCYATCR